MGFLILLFIIFISIILWLMYRYQHTIGLLHKAYQQQKKAQREQHEEAARREHVRRQMHPEQETVDLVKGVNRDLSGGEYAEFEEIKEE